MPAEVLCRGRDFVVSVQALWPPGLWERWPWEEGGDSTGILGLWLWAKGKYVWAGQEALDSAFLLPPLGILESWLHMNL